VDVMTADDMDLNILATSDQPGAPNVIDGRPAYWAPPPTYDVIPMLQVILPVMDGIPPERYDLMTIKVKAQNFRSVTVSLSNSRDEKVFSVSLFHRIRHNT